MSQTATYSDGDLVRAVESSHSWRGVLRALNLRATSSSAMRSVRGHADRLGLDYCHFTGQRRWSDRQLAAALEVSRSWREVAEVLGLAGGSSHMTLKGHAVRLGLPVSHLDRRPEVTEDAVTMRCELSHLPRAGPLMAAAWFVMCGYQVCWPLEPTRYDLLVERGGKTQRVQVKTGSVRVGDGWQVWLSTTGRVRRTYDPDEIELFFIIDADLTFYVIPVAAVAGLHAVALSRYSRFKVGRHSGMSA